MNRARTALLTAGLGAVLSACAARSAWTPRPAAPQPPTHKLGGVIIATICEDLPDLTEEEVARIVEQAQKVAEGHRVRQIFYTRAHPGEFPWMNIQFEYHETHARIRFSRRVECYWIDGDKEGERGKWFVDTEVEPGLDAEVCAPGRSFLDGAPIPPSQLQPIGVSGSLTADEIVEIVDAVYDHVPDGERLSCVDGEEDGAYALWTVVADTLRALHGSVMEARRTTRGWDVDVTGTWIS